MTRAKGKAQAKQTEHAINGGYCERCQGTPCLTDEAAWISAKGKAQSKQQPERLTIKMVESALGIAVLIHGTPTSKYPNMRMMLTEDQMPGLRQVWESQRQVEFIMAISQTTNFDALWEHVLSLDKPEGELARLLNSGKDIVHLEDDTPDNDDDAQPGDVVGGALCGINLGDKDSVMDCTDPQEAEGFYDPETEAICPLCVVRRK